MAPAPTVIKAITMPMKPTSPEERGLGLDLPAAALVAELEAALPLVVAEPVVVATLDPDLVGELT